MKEETLKEKRSRAGKLGGKKKKGKQTDATKLKTKAKKLFTEKASKMAGVLLMAQAQEALGTYQIIRKDEIYSKKGKMVKIEWKVITAKAEIEKVMNHFKDIDGAGEIDGKYYMISRDKPNYRASDAIMNRALGRPTESHEHTGKDGDPLIIKLDS